MFLLSFDFSVLDVNTIFIDVSLLMIWSNFSILSCSFLENNIIVGIDCDVSVQLLDVFFVELMEEVDDESSWNFIYLYPWRMNDITFCFSDSFSLISINLEEFLWLNDVETEKLVFSDRLFSRSVLLDWLRRQIFKESFNIFFSHFFSDHWNHHCSWIFDISQAAIKYTISELWSQSFEMFISLYSFFIAWEGKISPSSSFLMNSSISIDNIPMKSLSLHKFLDLISKGSGIFSRVRFNTFQMKNIRLIFLSILINLTFGHTSKFIIFVDQMWNTIENNFILIFPSGIIEEILTTFDMFISNIFSLPDITDIEEHSSISEWLLIILWFRDCDFVDLDIGVKKRFDNSLNLFLEILIIEIISLVLFYFFLW